MPSNPSCRYGWSFFAVSVVVSVAVQGFGAAAKATPQVSLSPGAFSISPGESVEVEVFIENVTDLRLYEIVLEVTSGTSGSLDLTDLIIDQARGDFVFAGIPSLVCLPDPDNLRITCSPLSDDCVTVTTPPAYLGTYTFTASADANGTFAVNILDEPTTFLLDCNGSPIMPFTLTHATVEITTESPVPTVSEWGTIAMTLLILTAATLVLRQRVSERSSRGARNSSESPRLLSG